MFSRILTYSHDSYGLGHFRRSLTIAEYLLERSPSTTVLSLTGSPRSHSFHLPHRFDYVKLPSITKSATGEYMPRELDLSLEDVSGLRGAIISECVKRTSPDLLLVDHVPGGLNGELLQVLPELKRRGVKLVIGMRDIIDEPETVRAEWERDGVIDILREYYDNILIYGDEAVFDATRLHHLPEDLRARTRFTGYVVRRGTIENRDTVRSSLGVSQQRLVVVMAGGGGDGHRLLKAWLRGLRRSWHAEGIVSVVVTGPLMGRSKRERIVEMAAAQPNVQVRSFHDNLPSLLRAADGVVSMGGYNSVAEILDARVPAVIVPRVTPRREQWVRARALAKRDLLDCVHPEELTGRALVKTLMRRMRKGRPGRTDLPRLDGLKRTWMALSALAGESTPEAASR